MRYIRTHFKRSATPAEVAKARAFLEATLAKSGEVIDPTTYGVGARSATVALVAEGRARIERRSDWTCDWQGNRVPTTVTYLVAIPEPVATSA